MPSLTLLPATDSVSYRPHILFRSLSSPGPIPLPLSVARAPLPLTSLLPLLHAGDGDDGWALHAPAAEGGASHGLGWWSEAAPLASQPARFKRELVLLLAELLNAQRPRGVGVPVSGGGSGGEQLGGWVADPTGALARTLLSGYGATLSEADRATLQASAHGWAWLAGWMRRSLERGSTHASSCRLSRLDRRLPPLSLPPSLPSSRFRTAAARARGPGHLPAPGPSRHPRLVRLPLG